MGHNSSIQTKEKGRLILLWALLMLLTITGYFSSEDLFTGQGLAVVLMALTAIKFLVVGFWYMEGRKAHPFWKWVLVFVLTAFSLLIILTTV